MERIHAEQIARLLNDQNQLTIPYTAETVLEHAPNYLVRIGERGEIIACAELKAVQWYQYELLHVTVAQTHLRGGLARSLIAEAEQQARLRGARILQSTIRTGNLASERLFKSCGFENTCRFYNQTSKNVVGVWQRVLSMPPPASK